MSELSLWIQAARENWHWQGQGRPSLAQIPNANQESVWDYPRRSALLPITQCSTVRARKDT